MSTSKKITSINKRLNTIFKDMRNLPFEDINKILFNIELLKNKHLHRTKQGDFELYEEEDFKPLDLKAITESLRAERIKRKTEPPRAIPYEERPSRMSRCKE